jgi:hypothetical protein
MRRYDSTTANNSRSSPTVRSYANRDERMEKGFDRLIPTSQKMKEKSADDC